MIVIMDGKMNCKKAIYLITALGLTFGVFGCTINTPEDIKNKFRERFCERNNKFCERFYGSESKAYGLACKPLEPEPPRSNDPVLEFLEFPKNTYDKN